jgi:hypothetical protein
MSYAELLERRQQFGRNSGFEPTWFPDKIFPFQRALVEWAVRLGCAELGESCGLGKSLQELTWAENVIRHTNKPVLLLTPLAVGPQMVAEGEKFGIDCERSRDGKHSGKARVVVANYQILHKFNPNDFAGVVGDESSILKNPDGFTRGAVTEFMRRMSYRLLATATPAPNDYIELGTSSEALGYLGHADMMTKFFKKVTGSKRLTRSQENRGENWRFRGHAEKDFWRWVTSWMRAIRRPSDIGCDDTGYILPEREHRMHIVEAQTLAPGMLFALPAVGLQEQRGERRRTIEERCAKVAELVNDTGKPAVSWCHLNPEGNLLAKMIPDADEVHGGQSDDKKEELLAAFSAGQIRVLITKPQLAGYGLNWQHCAHQTFFPSHSFEQYHQCVCRSDRFGQKNRVTVDMVSSEGEADVLVNLERKRAQMEVLYGRLVDLMNDSLSVTETRDHNTPVQIPSWLK